MLCGCFKRQPEVKLVKPFACYYNKRDVTTLLSIVRHALKEHVEQQVLFLYTYSANNFIE
jgi:hypothetical protein